LVSPKQVGEKSCLKETEKDMESPEPRKEIRRNTLTETGRERGARDAQDDGVATMKDRRSRQRQQRREMEIQRDRRGWQCQ
jgi:hypothetical protein